MESKLGLPRCWYLTTEAPANLMLYGLKQHNNTYLQYLFMEITLLESSSDSNGSINFDAIWQR